MPPPLTWPPQSNQSSLQHVIASQLIRRARRHPLTWVPQNSQSPPQHVVTSQLIRCARRHPLTWPPHNNKPSSQHATPSQLIPCVGRHFGVAVATFRFLTNKKAEQKLAECLKSLNHHPQNLKRTLKRFKKTCLLMCLLTVSVSNIYGQRLTGIVVDSEQSTPLEAASVVVFDMDSILHSTKTCDASGRFEIEVTLDTYFVKISSLGYFDYTTLIRKAGGENIDMGAQI